MLLELCLELCAFIKWDYSATKPPDEPGGQQKMNMWFLKPSVTHCDWSGILWASFPSKEPGNLGNGMASGKCQNILDKNLTNIASKTEIGYCRISRIMIQKLKKDQVNTPSITGRSIIVTQEEDLFLNMWFFFCSKMYYNQIVVCL